MMIVKKIFRILLLLSGIFFLCLSATCGWLLVSSGPLPTHEELVQECEEFFSEGSYSSFDEDERLGACLDDSYKAVGAATGVPFLIIVFGILAWINFHFWLRMGGSAGLPLFTMGKVTRVGSHKFDDQE